MNDGNFEKMHHRLRRILSIALVGLRVCSKCHALGQPDYDCVGSEELCVSIVPQNVPRATFSKQFISVRSSRLHVGSAYQPSSVGLRRSIPAPLTLVRRTDESCLTAQSFAPARNP